MQDNNTTVHSTLDEGYDFYVTDKWNRKNHFKIATFAVPSGFLSEAYEVTGDDPDIEPRVFHVLSGFGSDTEKAELQLKAKVKKGIDKRYLVEENGNYSLGADLEAAGRIMWSDDLKNSGFEHFFQIDGKKITVEKFVGLLKAFEGFNFKFRIIDTTDDLD